MKRHLIILGAVVAGGVLGVVLDRAVFAQQSGITRTILQRVDVPSSTTYETVMGTAELAPGASAGNHRHPGVEIGYVLEGTVIFSHQGRQPVTKKAGEYFQNDVGAAHDAKNASTTASAKILAIYVVEKGKPLAEPVK